jgi:hypothetical protein
MKTKLISLFALTILSLVFLVGGMVSAAVIFSPNPVITEGNQGELVEVNFTIENDYAGDLIDLSFDFSNLLKDSFSIPSSNLDVELPEEIGGLSDLEVTLKIQIPSEQEPGIYNGDAEFWAAITSDPSLRETLNITLTVTEPEPQEQDFCSYDDGVSENPGDLKVEIKDISVTNGFGDDEEWLLLDEIEVEIEIENKGDYDVDDISVEWGIADESMNEWVIEMDEIDEFNIKDGDEEKLVITFRIDDDLDIDLDELEGSYYLYVRATGEVDDDTNPMTCASDSEAVSIEVESDFVILTDIEVQEVVQCDTEVQITADVWNIGDRDQDEVYVIIYNKELGINEKIEIGDVDAFEDEKLDALIKIPSDAEEKTYSLKLTVYDEDDDIYENDYDEEESIFNVFFKVEGNCGSEPNAVISASLESGGKAGQPLVIKATIVNTGDDSTTFSINAAGYTEWASSAELSQSTVLLNAGDSINVLMTFDVKKDVSGEKTFNIEILSENKLVLSQPVSVIIEKSGFSFTGGVISGDNWYLWGIGAINFILIIVIIFVAIRVARK